MASKPQSPTCVGSKALDAGKAQAAPCGRRAAWHIEGVGHFCQWCFDVFYEKYDVDAELVTRLAVPDRLFVTRMEPGRGHNQYSK